MAPTAFPRSAEASTLASAATSCSGTISASAARFRLDGAKSTYGGALNNFGIVQKYRPIFYDFNAVYGRTFPKKKVGADVMAGIGGLDLRFYQPFYSCGAVSCTNYTSINHFAGHFGADLRFYFWGHAFIRPEAHYYIVHNNVEFNNVNASRFTISIGYSFLPGF